MNTKKFNRITLTALLLVAVLFPFFADFYILCIGISVLIAALLGQSWNIMSGYAGQFSFGHAVFFGIGALCTGIAGALLTPILSIYPTLGETFQLKCFVIAILGGMGNLWGALISGLIVGIVESLTGYIAGGSWSDLTVYAAFILILLVKPSGLFGRSNRREH